MKSKQMPKNPIPTSKSSDNQTLKKQINPTSWLYAALILATIVFIRTLFNGFVNFDDDTGILANSLYHNFSFSNIIAIFQNANLGMYAPISGVLYTFLYSISNGNPLIFHLSSLILHLINIVLVFNILKNVFSEKPYIYGLVTLIFAIHPMQTESIAWAAAMSTPLYAMFYLLSIKSYLSYKSTQINIKYWLSIIFFVLSLLSKSAAVTMPLILLLIDYLQDSKFGTKNWINKIPYFILALFFGILTFITRSNEGHEIALQAAHYSLVDRILMVSETLLFYFGKLLIPKGLCISYPFTKSADSWSLIYYIAPIILIFILYYCYKLYKSGEKQRFFGLFFYFISISVMLPIITIGNFELRSDRYNYLALIGFFIFIILIVQQIFKKQETTVWLGIVLIIIYSITSFLRVDVWKDSYSLFSDVIQKTENQAFAYYNRGLALYQNQDYNKAISDFNKTLQIDPSFKEVYARRAFSLLKVNNPIALQDFKLAWDQEPNNEDIMSNYAKACLTFGDLQKGVEVSNRAIQLNQKNPELYYIRGILLATGNVPQKAIEDYSMAIALNTNYADAYVNRGNIYANQQQYEPAMADFNAALKANPKHSRAFSNRANLNSILGKYPEAIADYSQAIAIDSKYTNAYIGRAKAYEKTGNIAAMQQDINVAKSLGVGK